MEILSSYLILECISCMAPAAIHCIIRHWPNLIKEQCFLMLASSPRSITKLFLVERWGYCLRVRTGITRTGPETQHHLDPVESVHSDWVIQLEWWVFYGSSCHRHPWQHDTPVNVLPWKTYLLPYPYCHLYFTFFLFWLYDRVLKECSWAINANIKMFFIVKKIYIVR